ncbi:MAG: thioredoxin [Clostridia bacterium]|nr:thioredoxin [Clostridia bacterium]
MAVYRVNENEFEDEVLKAKQLVVVDFNADWCGPCRMLGPVLEELSEEEKDVKFVSVNVDDNEAVAEKFGVFSIPCVVFVKDGKEVNRSVGFVPKSAIADILKDLK